MTISRKVNSNLRGCNPEQVDQWHTVLSVNQTCKNLITLQALLLLLVLVQLSVKKCARPMAYVNKKCDSTNTLSFLWVFLFFWAFINILTGTLAGSLSLFALFVIWLVTIKFLTLLRTLNNSITETCMTSTISWKQFSNNMLLHKIEFHKSCH